MLDLARLEKRIIEEITYLPKEESDAVIARVCKAVMDHVLTHRNKPSGIFQIEIIRPEDTYKKAHERDPKTQTHLVINFGEKPVPPGFLKGWREYYGKVICLQLPKLSDLSYDVKTEEV